VVYEPAILQNCDKRFGGFCDFRFMKTNFLSLFAAFFFASATLALAATNDLSGALQKGLFEEEANHNLEAAAQAYQSVAAQFDKDRKLAATAIFRLGEVYRKQGKTNEANAQYERILKEFSDQTELVKLSRTLGASGIGDQNSEIIRELEQNLVLAQLDYAKQKALFDTLTKLSGEQLRKSLPTIYPDSLFDALLVKLASAKHELESRKQEFALDHPEVKKAEAIVRLTEKQIDKRIDGIRAGLEAQVAVSKRRVEELQAQLSKARNEQPEKFRPQLAQVVQRTNSVSAEDQEIARIKTMIKDSPDLINAKTISVSGGAGTPLHKAAQDGQLIVAKFLQENGADINAVSKGGYTPLSLAAQSGNRAMVEFLLRHGADNSIPIPFGTPLHVAAQNGFKAVAETLLAHGTDVNSKDANGNTPLFSAVSARNLEMAKFLIANKADVNSVANEGWTPLHSAVQTGQLKLVELLLQNGANTEAKVNAPNFRGETALHLAGNGREIVELLLKSGANPNSTDDSGATPLHYAARRGAEEIAELLLAHGADVNAKTLSGETPLFRAVGNLKMSMVELLLKHKANPNLANNNDQTPLSIVLSIARREPSNKDLVQTSEEIAKLLIKYGADENYQRRTQIAVTRDFKQVYPIFHKGTNSWNRFSLLEVLGMAYSSPSTGFPFPNLSKIVIHRLKGKEEREVPADLQAILKSDDCSKNIWLEWGDVIEIPEKDHKVDEQWSGYPKELLEILPKCLARNISITVKGETKSITFAPKSTIISVPEIAGGPRESSYLRGITFWLNDVVSRSGLLRTSSDKTRVKVTRLNPVTKKSEEQIFNLEKPDPQNQLWLRDGDQIEIPEKP
jgi:ankyrin repeat protein